VGSLGRLGVVTTHFDPVPEAEMGAMAPTGISIHAARVWRRGDAKTFSEPPHIDDAVEMLTASGSSSPSGLAPAAILVAFATTSYLLGVQGSRELCARLESRSSGVPVVLTGDAATSAMHRLNVRRISLVFPPWFSSSEPGTAFFQAQGFEVVAAVCMEPKRTFMEVAPEELFAFVVGHTSPSAEAVFIAGNGLRAAGAIEALECRLGLPVLAANQVLLWDGLQRVGQASRVEAYGRIFRT
jgi:maleate isomerase